MPELYQSVVRFRTTWNGIAGAGFLAGRGDLIVTCAHVIEEALGEKRGSLERVNSADVSNLRFDFHPDCTSGAGQLAEVVSWKPPNPIVGKDVPASCDLAVLRTEQIIGGKASPVRWHQTPTRSMWDKEFSSFGFPTHADDGVPAKGWIRSTNFAGLGLLESTSAELVAPGFSGAPVLVRNDADWELVGMVQSGHEGKPTAYVLSNEVLIAACKELSNFAKTKCPYRPLQSLNERDELLGRAQEMGNLIQLVAARRFSVMVGPSGVGKSSLVHAGIVKALTQRGWVLLPFRPAFHPWNSFAGAAIPLLEPGLTDTQQLGRQVDLRNLLDNADGESPELFNVLTRILENHPDKNCLVVIDQFEDLYLTQVQPETRRKFESQWERLNRLPYAHPWNRLHVLFVFALTLMATVLPTPYSAHSFVRRKRSTNWDQFRLMNWRRS